MKQRECCVKNTTLTCKRCGRKWCMNCEGKEPLYKGSELILCKCGKTLVPTEYCA